MSRLSENQDLETQHPLQTALQALHPDLAPNAHPTEIALLQRLLTNCPDACPLLVGLTDIYTLPHTCHLLVHHLNTPEQPTLLKTLLSLHFHALRADQVNYLLSLVPFTAPVPPLTLTDVTDVPHIPQTCILLNRRGLIESDDQKRLTLSPYLRPYLKHRLGIEERERLQTAHDQHYRSLIHRAASKLRQTPDSVFLDRLDSDGLNILAFLQASPPDTLALLNSLWRWWVHRRPATEGIDLFLAAIHHAGPKPDLALVCEAERATGVLWRRAGRPDQAMKNLHHAIQHAQIARKEDIMMEATLYLAHTYNDLGNFETAINYARQSLQTALQLHDMWSEAAALNSLGIIALKQGQYASAQKHLIQANALYTHKGDHLQAAKVLNNIASIAEAQGDYVASEEGFLGALAAARKQADPLFIAQCLHNVATACCHLQKYAESNKFYTASLKIMLDTRYLNSVPQLLSNMAYVAVKRRDRPRALTLYGVSDSLRRIHAIPWPPRAQEEHTATLEAICNQTTTTVITRFYRKGYQMGIEELKVYLAIP